MRPDFAWRDEEMYLDNAATTMVDPEVVEAMRPYMEERYGNPETVYRLGREAQEAVEAARHSVAELLGCLDEEVYFTSGGTEANNWALKGYKFLAGARKLVVSAVEHPSVLEPARWLSARGLVDTLVELDVLEDGSVNLEALETFLKDGAKLVSVQYANNEVGTLQPVRSISKLCRKYGAAFHCDAVQAYGKVDMDVDEDGLDLVSLSAHKIHGPMGVGALYVRKGIELEPLHHGGGHERGMRSGTLAVHDIVGFGKAAEMAATALRSDMPRLRKMSQSVATDLVERFGAKVNGSREVRLPNIVSVTIPGMDTSLVCGVLCSKYGICVSSGSACSTGKRHSHVLAAMGKTGNETSTLRISLSRFNKEEDLVMLAARLQAAQREEKGKSLV
jgi:cysteine desulfurase